MDETALIPTCANTYGERGHKWRELIGGRRCDVCGKQEAWPASARVSPTTWLAEFYWLRTARPRLFVGTVESGS